MKFEFTEMEARFLKTALINLQEDVSADLREYGFDAEKDTHYYFLQDKLNACNDLIDKLHNWGI